MISERDYEALSAYVDGQLGQRDREALESRLANERELRHALKDLRQDRLLLQKLPTIRAPRNFTLTRAQAASIRAPRKPGLFSFSPFNALRLATGLASLLFVTLLGLDLARNNAFSAGSQAQTTVGAAAEPAIDALSAPSLQQEDAPPQAGFAAPQETTPAAEIAAMSPVSETESVEATTADLATLSQSGYPTELDGAAGGGAVPTEAPTGKMSGDTTSTPEVDNTLRTMESTTAPEATTLAFAAPNESIDATPQPAAVAERELQNAQATPQLFDAWTIGAGGLALLLGATTLAWWFLRRA